MQLPMMFEGRKNAGCGQEQGILIYRQVFNGSDRPFQVCF